MDGNHGNIHPKGSDFVKEGIPFVMANDFHNGEVNLKETTKITREQADGLQKGFSRAGDVLLTHKGSIGLTAIVPELEYDYIMLTPQVTYYRVTNPELLCHRFLRAYFDTARFQKRLAILGAGGTRAYVGITEQRSLALRLPQQPEQRKIADFLTAVDGRIGQLIQKKALLEDYKKGVMQQLFTQSIRFKDDHGNDFPDWEEKKLGELTKWASGGTPSKDNSSFWEGDIPWMSAASMHERYYDDSPLKITKEGVKAGSKMALKGTLLLLVRGSMLWNRIPVGITTRDVAFNQDVKALTPTNKIQAGFLLQWFIASENMLLHKVVGTGIGAGKLDTDEMKRLRFRLPSFDEQTKIADFLSAIDRKIESVATQITETQTFKRGLLQQMFV